MEYKYIEHINKLYLGHNVEICCRLKPEIVDLTVTSPPYDGLRKYDGYVFDLVGIIGQLWRLTKPGGIVVWIVADETVDGSETGSSFEQAKLFKLAGFNLHDTMLYGKKTPAPPSIDMKRYASGFEYAFVFSKGKPNTFNPILEDTKWGGSVMSTGFRQPDGSIKNTKMRVINSKKIASNVMMYDAGYNCTTTDKFAFEHPAMFPEQLAKDHIYTWTNPGDLVFDPF